MAAFNAYNASTPDFVAKPLKPSLFLEFHGLSDANVEDGVETNHWTDKP
jgi:hypothetical protein